MAIEKFKQVANDPVLKDVPRAEHGQATFAHVNVLVEKINELEAIVAALTLRVEVLEEA